MASDEMNYAQQVAMMRQQRAQEQYQTDYNQYLYGREEALRNRQEIERQAAVASDPDEREQLREQWYYHDAEFQECDAEVRKRTPRQTPESVKRANYQDQEFYRREGQNGVAAMRKAHDYLVACGRAPYAPATIEDSRTMLEMYGQDSSISGLPPVRYDPNEQTPDWKEIAHRNNPGRNNAEKEQNYLNLYNRAKALGKIS
jgi:hypothetical protein